MAFVVPEKDVLGNQAAIDVTQKEQDIGRDCGDDHQRPTVYSHNYNDIGSDPSPAGSGNQSGLVGFAEDDSDNRGELWEQRLADSRVSDDEDVIWLKMEKSAEANLVTIVPEVSQVYRSERGMVN